MNVLNRTSLSIVTALSVALSLVMFYLRSDLFHFQHTFPATLSYFGMFVILLHYVLNSKFLKLGGPKRSDAEIQEMLEAHEDSEESKIDKLKYLAIQVGLFLALLLLSSIIGSLSGVVWWSAGGHEFRTLLEALRIGTILGAAMVLVVFGAVC